MSVAHHYNLHLQVSSEKLYAANMQRMACEGSAKLRAHVPGSAFITIKALVSSDLKDEVLICWHDLIELGVIANDFLNVVNN